MGRKKNVDKMLEMEIQMNGERLKKVISKFYPDGVRAEFMKASHVGKIMEGSPSLHRFAEDEQMRTECINLCKDANEKLSVITEIDLWSALQRFRGSIYEFEFRFHKVRIMFKATPEDAPVYLYLQEEYLEYGSNPRFLVDTNNQKAILIIEEIENFDNKKDFKMNDASFVELSELHIVFVGIDIQTDDTNIGFMTSFSKTDEKCFVEKIFNSSMCLLDGLLMSDSPSKDDDVSMSSASEDINEDAPAIITKKDNAPPPVNSEDGKTEIRDSTKE